MQLFEFRQLLEDLETFVRNAGLAQVDGPEIHQPLYVFQSGVGHRCAVEEQEFQFLESL